MPAMIGLLLVSVSGCALLGHRSVVLTSKDETWTIPKGATFNAVQTPDIKEITEFIAPDDLVVMYKGNLLELQEEANERVFKEVNNAKKKGKILALITGIIGLAGGLIRRFKPKGKKKGF